MLNDMFVIKSIMFCLPVTFTHGSAGPNQYPSVRVSGQEKVYMGEQFAYSDASIITIYPNEAKSSRREHIFFL